MKRKSSNPGLEREQANADLCKQAINYIESHLSENLSVDSIAGACHTSAFHFSRLFTTRHGESVMAYVRGRRLELAAQRLVREKDLSLVQLAFDTGFQSQIAFTRAFNKSFGTSPLRFKHSDLKPSRKRAFTMNFKPELIESKVLLDTSYVMGCCGNFEPSNYLDIPKIWQQFTDTMKIAGINYGETCGVFRHRDHVARSFEHLAGIRTEQPDNVPDNLDIWQLPKQHYLVYKQLLVDEALYIQVSAAQTEIWENRITKSGEKLASNPDFQLYPANFNEGKGGWIEHYIPIEN